jgi:arylsulfatase A-like enzyme
MFNKAAVAVSSVLAMALFLAQPSRGQTSRPNVLIILTDDQRADSYVTMPRTISTLRSEGTEYLNAIAVTPTCCPSRATIMSGQYPHNHGTKVSSAESAAVYNKANSLQADLKIAGYFTAITGKYFNGVQTNPPHFDRWAISKSIAYNNSSFNVDGTYTTETGYATTFIKNKTLEYLSAFEGSDDPRPWYVYVGFKAPHEPATPAGEYASAPFPAWRQNPANSESDLSDKPAYVLNKSVELSTSQTKRRNMYRTLYSVDDAVMEIFNRLRAMSELDDTLVLLLSDHGFMWWEHKLSAKHVPYEESLRIPFFVRWPGHFAAGARQTKVVATLDVAPTVYEATGVTPDHVIDGDPLLTSSRSRIFAEFFKGSNVPTWRALWSPNETYVRYSTGEREYYAPEDPWQIANRYKDGIPGNEPTAQAQWDRLLNGQATCKGVACQ